MHKRILKILIPLLVIAFSLTACSPAATTGSGTTGATTATSTEKQETVRTVAPREDALQGKAITPEMLFDFLPGIENPGVVPKKQFFIAFSIGDMGGSWARTCVNDMEAIATQYKENFGIKYEWVASGNNSTNQLADIQTLIAKKPDLLIVSPNEVQPLSVVVNWCNQAKIPLVTIIEGMNATPGEGYYVGSIPADCFENGVANALSIVKTLTARNGSPKGNVVEVAGILGASTSMQRSWGMNWVLKDYPEIKITISRAGEWDPKVAYEVAQDILTSTKPGDISAICASNDESAIAFMEAQKAAGRDELNGCYWGNDGTVSFLKKILDGTAIETNEANPYYGYFAFEYALQYLNGATIPAVLPMPNRDFSAETAEKKEALQKIVDYCDQNKFEFVPVSAGGYDIFKLDPADYNKYYEPAGIWKDKKYTTFMEPYQTSPN